jgi:hypothetical protein
MKKIVRIGKGEYGDVFCKIIYINKVLSISGVEGPTKNGDCKGSCGQILDEIRIEEFAKGWDERKLKLFLRYWKEYHLNDMQAGCIHQRAWGWKDRRIDPSELPKEKYYNHDERGIIASWVFPKDHPKGILSKPCPICDYRYGSDWLYKEVPESVIYFLFNEIPVTDEKPAWV